MVTYFCTPPHCTLMVGLLLFSKIYENKTILKAFGVYAMVVGQKSNRTNLKPENILPQINLRFKSAQKLGSLIDAVEAVSFQMSLLNYL